MLIIMKIIPAFVRFVFVVCIAFFVYSCVKNGNGCGCVSIFYIFAHHEKRRFKFVFLPTRLYVFEYSNWF